MLTNSKIWAKEKTVRKNEALHNMTQMQLPPTRQRENDEQMLQLLGAHNLEKWQWHHAIDVFQSIV